MNRQEMSEILFELKTELAKGELSDPHQRQLTKALVQEIQTLVSDPKNFMSGDQFLLTELKAKAEEFETEHPKFTEIVGRLSDLLARMGI